MILEERYWKHAGEFLDRTGWYPGYRVLLAHFTWLHLLRLADPPKFLPIFRTPPTGPSA